MNTKKFQNSKAREKSPKASQEKILEVLQKDTELHQVSHQQQYTLENNEAIPSVFLGKNSFNLDFYIYPHYQSNVTTE